MNSIASIFLDVPTEDQSLVYPVISCCLLVVPSTILFGLIMISGKRGQDQHYHFALIDTIRSNRHRFVRGDDFFLIGPKVIYPQLVHWCLSLLPDPVSMQVGRYLSVVMVFLSTLAFSIFTWQMYPVIFPEGGPGQWEFLSLSLALYVFTPYSYYTNNAKNAGLSVRAVGVLLLELLFYSLVLYLTGKGALFLYASVVIGLVILLSSQFASQVFLFVLPVASLVLGEPSLLLVPALTISIYMVVLPGFFFAYARGQWYHKSFYCRYLAKNFILELRPSIWRDFIYDFWARFKSQPESSVNGALARRLLSRFYWTLKYALGNSVILLVVGMPLVLIATVLLFTHLGVGSSSLWGRHDTTAIMGGLVLSALVVFFLTTFRPTRFLGEPERYAESVNVLAVILTTLFLINMYPYWVALLSAVFIVTLLFLLMQVGVLLLQKYESNGQRGLYVMRNRLLEIASSSEEPPRVLANGMFQIRSLMSSRLRLVYGWAQFRLGGLPYREVVEGDRMYRREYMGHLARYYDVNYLLLQAPDIHEFTAELEGQGLVLRQVDSFENCYLFELISERD